MHDNEWDYLLKSYKEQNFLIETNHTYNSQYFTKKIERVWEDIFATGKDEVQSLETPKPCED